MQQKYTAGKKYFFHFFIFIIFFNGLFCHAYAQEPQLFIGVWKGGPLKRDKTSTKLLQTTLIITSVSGNNYEGIVKRYLTSDSSYQYNSKVSGIIGPDSLIAILGETVYKKNPPGGKWDTKCSGCGAVSFAISVQNEKLVLTGETKCCDPACNGISIYSRDINEVYAKAKIPMDTLKNENAAIAQSNEITERKPVLLTVGDTVIINNDDAKKNETRELVFSNPPKVILPPKIDSSLFVQNNQNLPPDTVRRIDFTANDSIITKPVVIKKALTQQLLTTETKTIVPVKQPEVYEKRVTNLFTTYVVHTDSVLLRVFDNGVVDGDTVSVFFNDSVVVNRLGLTTKAYELKVPVNLQEDNKIVLYAHNLGTISPNTAMLEIYSGKAFYSVTISSDLEKSSGIILTHKKE